MTPRSRGLSSLLPILTIASPMFYVVMQCISFLDRLNIQSVLQTRIPEREDQIQFLVWRLLQWLITPLLRGEEVNREEEVGREG